MIGFVRVAPWLLLVVCGVCAAESPAPDYVRDVAPLFTKYCTGCHSNQDREGKLSLESFADLQKGGEHGAVVLPGQPDSSRLIRVLTGATEPRMPPEGEKAPTPEEIEVLRTWILAGGKGPQGAVPDRRTLLAPQITPAAGAAQRYLSLAYSPDGRQLALGRFGAVELRDVQGDKLLRVLDGLPGRVNAVHFSQDGRQLVAATGVSGVYGLAVVWSLEKGSRVRELEGHLDTLYDAEFSPDGKLLATCSYDRKVLIWEVASGRQILALEGHNDAVYDLAFSPDGGVLASASGDKTVKVWHVATGERLDTLGQPQAEQYAVAFSPDGRCIVAAGGDSRIRVWEFVSRNRPQINPLRHSRFAHEGAVLALSFSADGRWLVSSAEDRTVKLWDTSDYTQRKAVGDQPDHVVEVAVAPGGDRLAAVRLDGTLSQYPIPAAASPPATTAIATDGVPGEEPPPRTDVDEREPNDRLADAPVVRPPFTLRGRIHPENGQGRDEDLVRFSARGGVPWMIEINAAREKSPLDSRLEVLDSRGQPVPRLVMQAIRDSYFTFRGKDFDVSDDYRVFNWQEMEINEFLYANGEVVKLWHYPRGPDSGFIVYPGKGRRWSWFDTTPIAHALGEPCYIVEPRLPGESLVPNGLPSFTVYYENDDDGWRQWGSDSRILFVPPADGDYFVRVTDARGFGGDDYRYQLLVRPPQPDFQLKIEGLNPKVNAGSGKEFSLQLERLDAFEGEVRIDIEGLPPGFQASTPIWIQPGQIQAFGTINALPDAPSPTPEQQKASRVYATAVIGGRTVRKEVGSLGEVQLAAVPKVLVRLLPAAGPPEQAVPEPGQHVVELVIAPGETITARVKVERHDFKDRIPFGNFDAGRNLPHGVYVDNIGLNGLMIVEGQDERIFFITAAKWVPEQTRMFHLQAQVDGNQTSWPVRLRVRRLDALVPSAGSD